MAAHHTVYAPEHPGLTDGEEDAISHLDNLWDLVLYYYELFDALGLKSVPVIGHSFGAMMAAELAANNPERVSKLILMCPIGLWREDAPIPNWMIVTAASDLPRYLMHDSDGPLAQQTFGAPDAELQIRMIWSMACTGKFVWPIPDKGLKKRIHRIQAPTMVLWGKQDRLVPVSYAEILPADSRREGGSDRPGRTLVPRGVSGASRGDGGRLSRIAVIGRRNWRRLRCCPSPCNEPA